MLMKTWLNPWSKNAREQGQNVDNVGKCIEAITDTSRCKITTMLKVINTLIDLDQIYVIFKAQFFLISFCLLYIQLISWVFTAMGIRVKTTFALVRPA
jgi:hypothetical protein